MKKKIDETLENVISKMSEEPRTAIAAITGTSFLFGVFCLMTVLEMVKSSQEHNWISFLLMIPLFIFMAVSMLGIITVGINALYRLFEEDPNEDRD